MLTPLDPITIPTTAALMYGVVYTPKVDLLTVTRQQYQCNSDGTNALAVGQMIRTPIEAVSESTDDSATALFTTIQAQAASFAAAKGMSGEIGYILTPFARNGAVSASLVVMANGNPGYVCADVYAAAQTDGSLAALVVPFQAAIATYAAAEGW